MGAIVVCGAVLGLFGGFVQAVRLDVVGIAVPIGAALVLAGLVATERALVHAWGRRTPAVGWFTGWLAATVLLAVPLPGGDVVIGAGAVSMFYVFGGAVAGAVAASLPDRLRDVAGPVQSSGPA